MVMMIRSRCPGTFVRFNWFLSNIRMAKWKQRTEKRKIEQHRLRIFGASENDCNIRTHLPRSCCMNPMSHQIPLMLIRCRSSKYDSQFWMSSDCNVNWPYAHGSSLDDHNDATTRCGHTFTIKLYMSWTIKLNTRQNLSKLHTKYR